MTPIVTLAAYDPNDVKPGWVAFWIVMALCAATVLLWWSMNRQLRKIKAPHAHEADQARTDADGAPSVGDRADEGRDGPAGTP
jgi:hypothetical protein